LAKSIWQPDAKASPFGRSPLKNWTLYKSQDQKPSTAVIAADRQDASSFPSRVIQSEDSYVVSFDSLARFEVSFASEQITAFDIAPDTDDAALTHLLFDHIAPRILAHQGKLVLHGSAVAIDGKVAVFIGETGAGKSTLAASLGAAGHELLGDDAVIVSYLDGRFWAEPVYPSLRLYSDSIEKILGDQTEFTAMAHYSDKQRVTVSQPTHTRPFPLAALFVLSGEDGIEAPVAHRPNPAQACIWTLEQSFSLDPQDGAQAANRLNLASRLIENVGTFLLDYPYEYDRLDEVQSLIADCMVQGIGEVEAAD